MEGVPSLALSPPVFIDTNLDTHLAMIVSPEDTVADLKRKVCLEHASCFPDIGDVTVRSIKVRRKAMYYHLSDSLLVRTAFDGIKGTWFLQMDMTHIDTDGTLARGNGNKREEGVTGGPSFVNVPVNADSNMINDQSLRGFSLLPSLNGQNKSPRSLALPSNNVLLITDLNDETSKDKSEMVKASHTSENSAAGHEDRSHVVNSESYKLLFQANRVSRSDFQLTTDICQSNKDAYDKDFTYPIDAANDDNAYIVTEEKETPRKRGMEKKRHKEEEEKKDTDSRKSPEKNTLEAIEAENLEDKNIFGDHIEKNIGLLGDMCSPILKDDTTLPHDIPHEKKKRKKKKRKECDEHHNEIDLDACEPKNSARETGLFLKSNESDLALLGEKVINYHEKLYPTCDKNTVPNSAVKLASKAVGDPTNENHVEIDSGVPAKEKTTNKHQRRKKMRKDELYAPEVGKTEVIHPIGKQMNEDSPEEEPEHDPKCVAKEFNKEIVCKETSRPEFAVEIVPKYLPTDGRISSNNKKRSRKAVSSKVKSSKDGASSSELTIEEASVIPENFTEAESLAPRTNKCLTSSKKGSVKAKESSKEAPLDVDPPPVGPPSLEEQSLTTKHAEVSNERASSDASFMSKATQEEPTNAEGGHTTRKNRRRKMQEVDAADYSLVELPNDLSVKQKNKQNKQNAPENPQVVQNDKRKGNPDLLYIDISPDLQMSKSSQDHQEADIHDQDISNGNEIKKPKQSAEEKGTVDHLGPNSHSIQQKVSGDNDCSMKQVNANLAASNDSTEEDTPFNKKLYHVAMRKNVSKIRSRKDLNQSKQEAFPTTEDNIFGHFTNITSEDEVNGKDANKNVIDDSTSDDSEDLEHTQVILGLDASKGTSSQGASRSSSHLLHKKEAIDDDILPSQTSKAGNKHVKLGVLLRSSRSYRKAKMTA